MSERIAAPYGMAWIAGGQFTMGSDRNYVEERPARAVRVSGFFIDIAPVTNRDFARFVAETGYVTLAERPIDPALYPGAAPEALVPASLVFTPPSRPVPLRDWRAWWKLGPGASWRHPYGPDSTIDGLGDHPVVHVVAEDAQAYADWAGKALPTEAEWEFAARGGLEDAEFAWGDEFIPEGKHLANTWQGNFPAENLASDGYERTSPVGAFPPNGHGLYDMIGNVWEWTADWWTDLSRMPVKTCCAPTDPRGGGIETSHDPALGALAVPRRVIKGGSHLCAPSYCRRYRPAARQAQALDSATSHIGFRCVLRPEQ